MSAEGRPPPLAPGVDFQADFARFYTAGGHVGAFNNNFGTINFRAAAPPKLPPEPRCPPASSNFVGRTQELMVIWSFFFGAGVKSDERRIFIVQGIGGCGKTQLSRKHMKPVYDRFAKNSKAHLVFYIDATTPATLEAGFSAIAKANGIGASKEDVLQWISNLDEEFFLYLDNTDDPNMNLRDFFSHSDYARILVTTRLPNFKRYGSGHGSSMELSPLSKEEAIDLFSRTAGLSEREASDMVVVTLVESELYYHALAVVQVGACVFKSKWTVQAASFASCELA